MAAAAEALQAHVPDVYELYEANERYRESLTALRQLGAKLGALALRGASAPEGYRGAEQFAKYDLMTALGEHLQTDKEFQDLLEVERTRTFEVYDGAVTAEDGRSMRSVLKKGIEYSSAASESDKRMVNQKIRDKGDLAVLDIVEGLRPGESYTVVSMYPEEAMARDGRKFWEDMGYRAGVNYVQHYVKDRDNSLLTGTYSVENSDKRVWGAVLEAHGITVPEDTPADEWILRGIRQHLEPEKAKTFAADLRAEYYAAAGKTHRRISATSFLEERRGIVDACFNAYYLPLAKAIYSGRNEPALRQFAGTLLQNEDAVSKLEPAAVSELIRVANSSQFTADAGRLMERLIRYSIVEELRSSLAELIAGRASAVSAVQAVTAAVAMPPELMSQRLSRNIGTGLAAGRTYGGCAKSLQAVNEDAEQSAEANPQDVFGGKGRKKEDDEAKIPDNIRCIKCKKLSRKEQVIGPETWHCPKCTHTVEICSGKVLREGIIRRGREERKPSRHLTLLPGAAKLVKEAQAA